MPKSQPIAELSTSSSFWTVYLKLKIGGEHPSIPTDSLKINYVDLTYELYDEVIACKDSIYFKIGGHNTPKANNIIANELINSQGFIDLSVIRSQNRDK